MSARLTIRLAVLVTATALVAGPVPNIIGQNRFEQAGERTKAAAADASFLLPIEIDQPPLDSRRAVLLVEQLTQAEQNTEGEEEFQPVQWQPPDVANRNMTPVEDQIGDDIQWRPSPRAVDYGPSTRESPGWTWQLLPDGLLYRSYLAGTRESRISAALLYETADGWMFDTALGGRTGVLRYGTPGPIAVEGWQLDVEGAAFTRLNVEQHWDVDSVDFRFGVPLTYRNGRWQWKAGYYHLSAHAGDEFLVRNPGFRRINYVRDAVFFGLGYFARCDVRLYGEVGYAFKTDGGAEPLEIQFGADYVPFCDGGFRGAPYAAVNVHLREEVDFGGGVNLMAGWMWQGPVSNSILRAGLQYYNGKSTQYAFFRRHEELIGFGLWYDY